MARHPSPRNEGTAWNLSKIEPASGKVVYTAEIPSSARHLTMVPGPNDWAFIEKGEVKGLGQQEIASMRLVSSQIIENPSPNDPKDEDLRLCK